MKTVLITGADGFLGSFLTDSCLLKGYKVIALKKPLAKVENLIQYTNGKIKFSSDELTIFLGESIQIPTTNENIIILECNLKNQELTEKIIKNSNPQLIFHFGAQPYVLPSWEDPTDTIETNVIGTLHIFETLKKNKIKSKVVVACSSAEYGTTTELKRALNEEDRVRAIHPYGISKVAAELLSRQYFINFGIETINLRFFNQTGPRKINDATSDFVRNVAKIEAGLSEQFINVGNLDSYRDILGITDSLQAIWLAATKGIPGETYNICSNRKVLIRDILNQVISLSSKKIEIVENTPEKLRITDEDIILGDNSKIKALGFEITQSIEDLVKDMFDFWLDFFKRE